MLRASQAGDEGDGGLLSAGVGVEVVGGDLEVGVAEELLDSAHVHSTLRTRCDEGVPNPAGSHATHLFPARWLLIRLRGPVTPLPSAPPGRTYLYGRRANKRARDSSRMGGPKAI